MFQNFLVSLDGAEGRQSKPYQMSKAAEFLEMDKEGIMVTARRIQSKWIIQR